MFFVGCTQPQRTIVYHWQEKQQMIVVLTDGWYSNQGKLYQFEYTQSGWQKTGGSVSVSLGSQGLAWGSGLHPVHQKGVYKREGDKRSPAGIFNIGIVFGYDRLPDSIHDPVHVMNAYDYCVDDPTSSHYNQIVDDRTLSSFDKIILSEPMRRDIHLKNDQLYKLGFVIDHNEDRKPFYGSCIFAHLRTNDHAVTAGCTAMDEKAMKQILLWLNRDRHPVFVLLPRIVYQEKEQEWDLPNLKNMND